MKADIKKISFDDGGFPALLKEIPGAPRMLYFLGVLPKKEEKLVAIVGTRKATAEGKLLAKNIGKELAAEGVVIVSGLALGIDAAAHEGALVAGGKTIAVLANGLDKIYPATNENLGKRIIESDGVIFSEYSAGTPALPHQFLERNRIVSGLSIATIVIEAPIHSGALVTAKNAIDQGREVFVFPGPANHPNFQGSHMLIRNGARLVTNASDILEDLGLEPTTKKTENLTDEGKIIIEVLKINKTLTIDKIIEATKLETHKVSEELTYLSLSGMIEEKNGKFYLK
ncbi:MAG: DNA-processing protein DprA [Patescibacteria group bacterium]